MKMNENRIYELSTKIETIQSELKEEKERVIQETIKMHAEALYKELKAFPIEEFTLRDIEQYFKAIVWDIKDIYKG